MSFFVEIRHQRFLFSVQIANERVCQCRRIDVFAQERSDHVASRFASSVSQETLTESLAGFATQRLTLKVLLPYPGCNATRQQVRVVLGSVTD